jgi:hypothetical protein
MTATDAEWQADDDYRDADVARTGVRVVDEVSAADDGGDLRAVGVGADGRAGAAFRRGGAS